MGVDTRSRELRYVSAGNPGPVQVGTDGQVEAHTAPALPIGLFQEAKGDPKNRGSALSMLAQSFERIGWNDEAIQTYRSALDQHSDQGNDLGILFCLKKTQKRSIISLNN